jgi:hypothetical protein
MFVMTRLVRPGLAKPESGQELHRLVEEMRRESADFIGARSGTIGCNQAGYKATILPVRQNTRTLAHPGCVHIAFI